MRKWEDIVKDMMEEPEGALPESVFAEFRARRTAGGAVTSKNTRPLVWAMAAAVAAGLAAVLLLRKPTAPEEGIQHVQQPSVVQVQVDDSVDVVAPVAITPLIAQATPPRTVRQPAAPMPKEIVPSAVPEDTIPVIEPEKPDVPETEEIFTQDAPVKPTVDKQVTADSSPFIPPSIKDKDVKVNVGSGVLAAGGGLLAALATQLARADLIAPIPGNPVTGVTNSPGATYPHRMPLIIGVSVKYPVTDKLGITTGLDYSLYSSVFTYPTGKKTQLVHYLGIPVRLDWTLTSGKWFDAYLGAGIKGDLCMSATLAGEALGKDGPAFRLLGVSGIQFNATSHLGIYVEPGISWTLPSERRVLSTYSSDHPWMFTVATGVRFNLGN